MFKIGNYILPLFILAVILFSFIKKLSIFDDFNEGAKEGLKSAVSLMPTLIALITAVKMLEASGAIDIFTNFCSIFLYKTGFPKEAVSLAILRTISGSGSLALLQNLFEKFSPDEFIGRLASVMFCSYDTLFYIISVYFGSIKYKKGNKVIIAAICGYIVSVILSFVFVRLEATFL